MTIQDWLSAQKRKSGKKLTDDAAAELFGCDRAWFSKIRRGKGTPSYDLMCAIRDKTAGKVSLDSWADLRAESDAVSA